MRGDLEGEWIHGYVWLNPSAFCSPEAITALLISYESVSHSVSQLCYPMGLPDSVHGILQARILEWVAISYSRGSSQPRYQTWVSCITGRFFTIWATICQYKIKRFVFFFFKSPFKLWSFWKPALGRTWLHSLSCSALLWPPVWVFCSCIFKLGCFFLPLVCHLEDVGAPWGLIGALSVPPTLEAQHTVGRSARIWLVNEIRSERWSFVDFFGQKDVPPSPVRRGLDADDTVWR